MRFSTRTIHAAQPSEPATGSLIAPIFQTSTYEQDAPGEHRGFDYSRTNNPTRAASRGRAGGPRGGARMRRIRVGAGSRKRGPAGVA